LSRAKRAFVKVRFVANVLQRDASLDSLVSMDTSYASMQALVSPYQTRDLERAIPAWLNAWGLVGRILWKIFRPTVWQAYHASVERQIQARGTVPESAWGTPERVVIARRIEVILARCCWGQPLSFHPADPWLVVGEWEIGNLSELDAYYCICKEFGLPQGKEYFRNHFAERIARGMTIGEFVTFIEQR
jgi:hypothetical protein